MPFVHNQTFLYGIDQPDTSIYAFQTATPTVIYYPTVIYLQGLPYQFLSIAPSASLLTDLNLTLVVSRTVTMQYLTVGGGGGGAYYAGGGGGGCRQNSTTFTAGNYNMYIGGGGQAQFGSGGGQTYILIGAQQVGLAQGGGQGSDAGPGQNGACGGGGATAGGIGSQGGNGGRNRGGGGGLLPEQGTNNTVSPGGRGLTVTFGNVTEIYGSGGPSYAGSTPGWGGAGSGGRGNLGSGRPGLIKLLWPSTIV